MEQTCASPSLFDVDLPISGPKQRVTITAAEYQLLQPGLDLLACGLAGARLGLFPHRYVLHLTDFKASAKIYPNRQFAPDMAGRIVAVRAKLWDLTQSRKIRFDVIDLAALQFSARLLKLTRCDRLDEKTKCAVQMLIDKLEISRRRAKQERVKQGGECQYRALQQRWERFVDWCRYNLLQVKVPKVGAPTRKRLWREQTEQLAAAVAAALASSHYEPLPPEELTRITGLLKISLRRGRQGVRPRQLLKAPEQHGDLLVNFVRKRTELTRTPGAPLPYWEAAMLRGEVFAAYQNRFRAQNSAPNPSAGPVRPVAPNEKTRQALGSPGRVALSAGSITSPTNSEIDRRIQEIRKRLQQPVSAEGSTPAVSEPNRAPMRVAQTVVASVPTTHKPAPVPAAHRGDRISDEELYGGLAAWFVNEVNWRYVSDIVREAQRLVDRNVHRSFKRPTTSRTVPEILKELQLGGATESGFNMIEPYVSTLLACLLAVRSDPGAIYDGIAHGYAKAKVMKEGKF